MITISNETKLACNSDEIRYKEYIIIDGNIVEIQGKMSNTAYKNTTFFGTFNLKMLEFTTENDIDYKNKEVIYYKQVNDEAFKIGTYIVTDVNDNDSEEEVKVTAMDYGLKFAIPYITELDYESGTVTLYDVLEECCTNSGVELENTTIANGDFIVDGNQFVNGEQIGTVVASIALICGNFATINENDKLELIFYKITETVDIDYLGTEEEEKLITEDSNNFIILNSNDVIEDYTSLEDKRDTKPITCISIGFSNIDGEEVIRKDDDLITEYGENWLRINDCPFAYSTTKMELLIDNIFNMIKGFGYSSFTSKYSFKPYLQLGDLIKFKNKNGYYVKSIILKIDTDYDDIILSAPSVTSSTINYEIPDSALEIAKRADISVNKANAQIILKVDNNGKIVKVELNGNSDDGTELNIDADQINLTATDIINLIAGNSINLTTNNISITSTNFSVDKDGNMTCNAGLFRGNVNTSQDIVVGNNVYVGQNQSSDYFNEKFVKFSADSYIRRVLVGNTELLSLKGRDYAIIQGGISKIELNGDSITLHSNNSGESFNVANFNPDSISFAFQPTIDSDKRLKKKIKSINVDWVDKLNVKEFEYKKIPNKKQIGLIAQDYIEEEYSKYFINKNKNKDDKEYYSIAYGNITNALIKYCQELKKEVNILKDEVKEIKNGYNKNN